ncbi:MAG: VOC family protein [Bacteroidota bacterium]
MSEPSNPHTAQRPTISGWHEAVLSVRDLEAAIDLYELIAGYEVIERSDLPDALLRAYRLPDSAWGYQALMRSPGAETGFLRIMQFEGVPQRRIRSHGRPWEPGGLFDVNAQVASMEETFKGFDEAGWHAFSDPVSFDFGPFTVKEWITTGPHGESHGFIEREAPTPEGWPALNRTSRLFNSTQIVADLDTSLDFYRRVLGFETCLEHHGPSAEAGPNVLGLPHTVATSERRHVYILHPQGGTDGSVELLGFDTFDGRHFGQHAAPPNLGLLALRFPVSNAGALAEHLLIEDIPFTVSPVQIDLSPYGRTTLFAVQAPEGAWLEFFETVR